MTEGFEDPEEWRYTKCNITTTNIIKGRQK
jgi:hypothetical protein